MIISNKCLPHRIRSLLNVLWKTVIIITVLFKYRFWGVKFFSNYLSMQNSSYGYSQLGEHDLHHLSPPLWVWVSPVRANFYGLTFVEFLCSYRPLLFSFPQSFSPCRSLLSSESHPTSSRTCFTQQYFRVCAVHVSRATLYWWSRQRFKCLPTVAQWPNTASSRAVCRHGWRASDVIRLISHIHKLTQTRWLHSMKHNKI